MSVNIKTNDWRGLFQGHTLTWLFASTCGALVFFAGFPNPLRQQIPFAAFVLPFVIYFLSSKASSHKKAFLSGWFTLFLGSTMCLYWVSIPMHDFAGAPWVAGAAASMLLGGYVGLYGGIFGLLTRTFKSKLPLPLTIFSCAILWGGLEIARGWVFTGFPWLLLSSSLAPWPVWLQPASIVGSYGLSAVYVFLILSFAEAVIKIQLLFGSINSNGQRRLHSLLCPIFIFGSATLCFAIIFGYSNSVLNTKELPFASATYRVGVIQGNIDQTVKWSPAWQNSSIKQYIALSEQANNHDLIRSHDSAREANESKNRVAYDILADPAASSEQDKGVDLLVWPETSAPFFFQQGGFLADRMRTFAKDTNTALLFGSPAYEGSGKSALSYNRVWVLNQTGENAGYYDKVHLVPFGEYVPLRLKLPFVDDFLQGYFFTSGSTSKTISLKQGDKEQLVLGPLICYEAIFPELSQESVAAGANILVNVSNDAWFGDSPAAEQHLQLATMRAVEQGRDFIRSTNTGISAIISKNGIVQYRTPMFRATQFSGDVFLNNKLTVFHRYYNIICAFLLGFPVILGIYCIFRRNK